MTGLVVMVFGLMAARATEPVSVTTNDHLTITFPTNLTMFLRANDIARYSTMTNLAAAAGTNATALYQTGTIQSMLESMSFGNAKLQIIVADRMPNTVGGPTQQCVLVQMTNDVVEIVDGQPPTVVPYTSIDNWTFYWTILAIQIPRVRADYNGQSGICIGSK